MTSILKAGFDVNIARTEARVQTRGSTAKGTDTSGQNFSKLLRDLDKTSKETSPLAHSAASPTPLGEDIISNLDLGENSHVRARLAQPKAGEDPSSALGDLGVKKLDFAVKSTAPPILVLQGLDDVSDVAIDSSPPKTPEIVSAKLNETGKILIKQVIPEDDVKDIILTAGRYHGVDPALGMSVAFAESNFDTGAISQDGHSSKGVFQLLDTTGKELMGNLNVAEDYDPFDAGMNSFLGVGYLRQLMEIFSTPTSLGGQTVTHAAKNAGDLEKLAVAAFNAGQGRVANAQARVVDDGGDPSNFDLVRDYLPETTRKYVDKVIANKGRYEDLVQQKMIT
jgi:soluble lytic murein transglycosylase-like protein